VLEEILTGDVPICIGRSMSSVGARRSARRPAAELVEASARANDESSEPTRRRSEVQATANDDIDTFEDKRAAGGALSARWGGTPPGTGAG